MSVPGDWRVVDVSAPRNIVVPYAPVMVTRRRREVYLRRDDLVAHLRVAECENAVPAVQQFCRLLREQLEALGEER